MGFYTEYLKKRMDFNQFTRERKKQLEIISNLRGGRDILVYSADISDRTNAPISIDFSDILAFQDQIADLHSDSIDIILETPGGFAEVVEDIVSLLRNKYDHIGIIIPGTSKSAGTILAMAADEILMGNSSSLGPIDAQVLKNNQRVSADAVLDGLEKIKAEVVKTKKLNPAYIPMLQNISPGEIQACENAQNFSKKLVKEWLVKYKFKSWVKHSSTGQPVSESEKAKKANQIANKLCKHSDWLTHGRSIKIDDLESMGLRIIDYSKDKKLNEAITRYYTVLRMSLETTNIYKIIETCNSQIMRFSGANVPSPPIAKPVGGEVSNAEFDYKCPSCKSDFLIQANFSKSFPIKKGSVAFPKNDIFACPNCHFNSNLGSARLQLEAQTGKKIAL